uniref:Pseudouridylate synthase 1 homolog n=1 Tax=Aceria tosichella TaxID=561515 RepID=A0A6G1SNT9_9ACAR
MTSKIRLRRFCLMLSYCGKQYSGMQRNPGATTIEECLLKALRDSDFITDEHYARPQLIYFQRAARTDKHVSAIRQIVSLKIKESIKDQLDAVNNHLPADIRLMGAKRVTGSFDAKNFCDARTYSYLMPSFALCPLSEVTKESYKVTPEVLKLFNETLKGYEGTHVFHNFTQGKKFKDDSAARVIRFMNCSEPFYPCNQNELEFVVVRVKGQSFMMHQIRKMIGLAIAVMKGFATEEHIRKSMEAPYMDIPKAPGLGLMLEEVHFDTYNRKFGGDGHHEPIEWEAQNDAIENFKNEHIYPVVVETELKEKSMLTWLQTLALHSYGTNSACLPDKSDLQTILASNKTIHDTNEDAGEETNTADDDCHAKKRVKLETSETTEQISDSKMTGEQIA